MVTQTKSIASSDGASIFASAYGEARKPAIVSIHGVKLSGDVFESLVNVARLSENFYLITYDMRGHGRSSKSTDPEGHASKLYANDFVAVCKASNVAKAFLLGYRHLLSYQSKSTCCNIYIAPGVPYIGSIMRQISVPTINELHPGLISTDNVELARITTVKFVESLFRDPADLKCRWMDLTTLQPIAVTKQVLDPTKLLEAAKAGLPCLILIGTADLQISGAAVEDQLKPYFINLTVKAVEGGAHCLFYEHKDEVISAISDLVASNK
ncbi:alpha/beta-hydrolase [Mycena floridula]|nr:alpha/beta-hydrolase [Mycena floridula]